MSFSPRSWLHAPVVMTVCTWSGADERSHEQHGSGQPGVLHTDAIENHAATRAGPYTWFFAARARSIRWPGGGSAGGQPGRWIELGVAPNGRQGIIREVGEHVCIGTTVTEKVRVVVADDHPLFRDGVVRALASSDAVEVVAEAADGATALALIKTHVPHVAVLDWRMPGMDAAQVAAAVRRDNLPTRVLVISAYDESAIVYHALQEGAAGFLPKETTKSQIVSAVLDCARGRDVLAPDLAAGLVGEIRRRAEPPGPVLTAREREVLGLIAGGRSVREIAAELHLSPATVKTYVQRLYEKLGVGDRGSAVAEAMRRRLLE